MLRSVIAVTVAAIMLAGCAAAEPAVPAVPGANPSPSPGPGSEGHLVGTGTVLDDGSGPEFCVGGVRMSLPPQCDGPRIVGWTWPEVAKRASGVTWAEAALLGTYYGRRFTVTRTLDAAERDRLFPTDDEIDFSSPCPEPAGGWRAPFPDRATAKDQQRVFAASERLPGYAESWIDDRGDHAQDPARIVVNVRVTGDVAAAEEELRKVWGGSLCVSRSAHTAAELRGIQASLSRQHEILTSGIAHDVVEVTVVHDDGSLQLELDQRYGRGLVQVTSALRPYEE